MQKKTVKYAVVGMGQIAQQSFIPGLSRADNSELVAFVSSGGEKSDALEKQYNVPSYRYEDLDRLIASQDVDAFYLATPNERHIEHAVPILEGGKHLLIEKPMATSVEECEAILAAQKKGGGKLMVAYRLHFEPGTVDLVERVKKGQIGDPVSFNSTFSQDVNLNNHRAKGGFWGGPVPDMGAYPINAMCNLFASEPVEVSAVGLKTDPEHFEFDDRVSVTLRFSDNRLAHFFVSYSSAGHDSFTLLGTQGSAHVSPCYQFGASTRIKTILQTNQAREVFEFEPVEQFGGEISYFSQCILHNREPSPDGWEGLLDVRILTAIEQSLSFGRPVSLNVAERGRKGLKKDQVFTLPPAQVPDDEQLIGVQPLAK
ncbi:Gfo/Idh/MocA family protein [Acetobacter cibinongensis]|uniref:Glucose-fructose oxidoreductase n=1 Tax=Acetobacter cibinongensis TaxID=146475 RepID=A0A1Z5YRH6_9PROT|nr:Gfo/Idh/MocA family oxidoreductase [Acetobacter cibinongensis]OUI99103.1 glucose-fructose oxidoreductase [Acetobacter cibinongensis]